MHGRVSRDGQGAGGGGARGDKEAQQKRVYYQGTLETDKANYWSPAFASRARGMPEILMALEPGHTLRLARGECRVAGRTIIASLVIGGRRKRAHDRAVDGNLLAVAENDLTGDPAPAMRAIMSFMSSSSGLESLEAARFSTTVASVPS